MRTTRWAFGALGVVAAVVLVGFATAWACVSGPAINLSTVNVRPGQDVSLSGTNFSSTDPDPVLVRWNSLDGPVIADLGAPSQGALKGTFTVPADAKPGNYVVIFMQEANGKLSTVPVRSLLTVTGPDGTTPVVGAPLTQQVQRPTGLVSADNSIAGSTLALIGLGVAGIGMLLAGAAATLAGRRRPSAQPVSSS